MTTTAHKIAMLEKYGFTIGERDERLNTNYPGKHMVCEANHEDIGDYDLPTADGGNGPWCIVGDDLDALVAEAHDYLLGQDHDGNGINANWTGISAMAEVDLPARRFTTLQPALAPRP